jgi:hypothetical protein
MFKNRTIQIDLVKKDQQKTTTTSDEAEQDLEKQTEVISDAIGVQIKRIGVMVLGYVVLDTVRKVVVNATTPT